MAARRGGKAARMLAAMCETARVASVMLDGDEAGRIIPEETHRYLAGIGTGAGVPYCQKLDHGAFVRTKKVLGRLARLVDFPCSTALWVPLEGLDGHVTLAVQNGGLKRFWTFGQSKRETPPEMADCMRSGRVIELPVGESGELLTVLAPVRDSLGDVVAVAELTARNPAAAMLDPAWS